MGNKLRYSCVCDVGKIRKINQDNYCCVGSVRTLDTVNTVPPLTGIVKTKPFAFFGVFDGIGGEECGEVASLIAARAAAKFVPQANVPDSLIKYCIDANDRICAYTKEHSISSMGTTAAILCFTGSEITLCNIGDSKIFRISEGSIAQISMDHLSFAPFGKKPPLSQSLGIPPEEMLIDPYVAAGDCFSGDRYIICSDGLTDMVKVDDILSITNDGDIFSAAPALLSAALSNGGKDNVTIIAIEIA